MNSKKILIGLTVVAAIYLGYNQYQQYQYTQKINQEEAETKRQYKEIQLNLQKEKAKGDPMQNMKSGTL